MKRAILLVLGIVVAIGGEWLYRTLLRPVDPLQPKIIALAEHFNHRGINVRPYAVRHGFRHSDVLAAAGLEIAGYPLPVSVEQCPTEAAAQLQLEKLRMSPNLTHPQRNGTLVMCLPMWGNDTEDMAKRVLMVFGSFKK